MHLHSVVNLSSTFFVLSASMLYYAGRAGERCICSEGRFALQHLHESMLGCE